MIEVTPEQVALLLGTLRPDAGYAKTPALIAYELHWDPAMVEPVIEQANSQGYQVLHNERGYYLKKPPEPPRLFCQGAGRGRGMSVIPTREEFEELVDSHERQAYLVAKGNRRANTRPSHTALLATYDAQAARIAELEAACEAALEAIRGDADIDWMLNVERQLRTAIAKARGGGG